MIVALSNARSTTIKRSISCTQLYHSAPSVEHPRSAMGCFNMYILNRDGTCLHYHEWKRPRPCDLPPEDDQKNMFGLLFALRTFTAALDPIRCCCAA